ncbi:Fanconi anemia group A protein-like [Dendronephthya gigantea]|uniref:Fanconi anemia group A protein-like n=1 Tax=Dendronephthya gigantea TaxID=151771 RepID=UPI00106CFB49|nr:Fanconi anemia group A protein-like [Dendronephthya gigantea]
MNAEELHKEVLAFVLDNVKISKVLEELSQDAVPSNDIIQMTEDSCMQHFHAISKTTCLPVSLVASQIFAQQLLDVVKVDQPHNQNVGHNYYHLLSYEVKTKVEVLLVFMNRIKDKETNCFDKLNFIKSLPAMAIPMELIWLLNENFVVSFQTCFLSWYSNEEWLERFCKGIASLFCDGDQDSIVLRKKILQVFIGDLLLMGYGNLQENKEVIKKTQESLFKLMKYTESAKQDEAEEVVNNWLSVCKVIRELEEVPVEIIQRFLRELLSDLLSTPCSLSVKDAISHQDKWTFEFLSGATRIKYLQFVSVFSSEDIIQIIQHAVESIKSETVNIKELCHLFTVSLVQNEESRKSFDDFLGQCLLDSLDNCDELQFDLVLLLRRQAVFEGNHISPSYATWFEQTFLTRGSSFGLNVKKTIHFFFKSLTELVPYDKPEFLKVHIFKCPQVPSKYKYYADDYISLAKTRLADLNIPLEENTGLFTQNSSQDEQVKVMEQARLDVKKCLLLYDESGKIPISIMEASIFRKPYFIGRFLPALFQPRHLPEEGDIKTRLIDELNRAGKIPQAMFKSYQRRCERLEGFPDDDKPRDNVKELTDCLEKLPNILVCMAASDDATQDLQSWFSSFSRKVKLIFSTDPRECSTKLIDVDLAAVEMDQDCLQASYVVINIFCKACVAVQNITTSNDLPPRRALFKFHWASKFVSILVSFPRLLQCVFVHLWSTICHESHVLADEHIHGLAILTCHLSCFKTWSIRAQTTNPEISLSSKTSSKFFLRWCSHYLHYAMVVFESLTTDLNQLTCDGPLGQAYVPKTMLTKVQYLCNKLKFQAPRKDFLESKEMKVLDSLIRSLKEIRLLEDRGCESPCLSFKQWLLWELDTREDFLVENERLQYYNWIVYEKFLPQLEDVESGELAAIQEIAKDIVSAIMDHWTRSPMKDVSSAGKNLIIILQDLVNLSNVSSEERTDVWFLDFFESRFNEIKKGEDPSAEIQFQTETIAFIRLATQLPSWLLVANTEMEWKLLKDENTKKFSQFLNDNLKPELFPDSMVFPFNLTAHILKIFLKRFNLEREEPRKAESILRCFLTDCHFIFASLMYYWVQLKPLYHPYVTASETLQQLQSYHGWLTDILTGKDQPVAQNTLPVLAGYEVGQSYVIFLHILKRSQASTLDENFVHRMTVLLKGLSSSQPGKRILVFLYDIIFCYLAMNIVQDDETKESEEAWYEITMTILFLYPEVLCVFNQELNQGAELLSARYVLFEKKTRRFLSILFFRLGERCAGFFLGDDARF